MSETDIIQLCGLDWRELDFRQREVLSALSEDAKATYSFQGLRRKLGLHQEMLSRTLDRLEEQELVEKTNDGYRISTSIETIRSAEGDEVAPIERQVITAGLPVTADIDLILNALKGRWFSEFRWLGYSETESELILSWITEDGRIQIRAKIVRNTIAISASYRSRTDEEQATRSAIELFDLVTKQNSLLMRHGILNQVRSPPFLNVVCLLCCD
jgi:hypothetical protein